MGKCEIRTGDYTVKDFLSDGIPTCNYGTMRNVFYQDRDNNGFLQLGSKMEMFKHYYDDLNVIRPIYGTKYDLRPLKLKFINRFCLKIADSPKKFVEFMSILNGKDKIEFICYKTYLKTHHYQHPASWSEKSCILSER